MILKQYLPEGPYLPPTDDDRLECHGCGEFKHWTQMATEELCHLCYDSRADYAEYRKEDR